jgi:dTDP-4-dehydrorhamnose reductase
MRNVLVTGAGGQMGQQFQLSAHSDEFRFYFFSREEFDILSYKSAEKVFAEVKPEFVVNFAAYTDVERAETDEENAFRVNVIGTKNLATLCEKFSSALIHLSTDYVFDGEKDGPYTEEDEPRPINFYGKTKFLAEREVEISGCAYVILRVAWIYSNYGQNFYLKMLNAAQKTSELNVVFDQWGTPTSAKEICRAIDAILAIGIDQSNQGVYHFAPSGKASWQEFAIEIFKMAQIPVIVNPVPAKAYATLAKRPSNSLMLAKKFVEEFGFIPLHWKNALAEIVSEKHISPIKVGYISVVDGEEYIIASVDWSKKEVVLAEINNLRNTLTKNFEELYE